MEPNPVEANVVTRLVLGFAVVCAMMIGGGAVGWTFRAWGIPYGDWIGTAIGAVLVFVAFAALYTRYDASFDAPTRQ